MLLPFEGTTHVFTHHPHKQGVGWKGAKTPSAFVDELEGADYALRTLESLPTIRMFLRI